MASGAANFSPDMMDGVKVIDISSDESSPFSPDEDLPQPLPPAHLGPRIGVPVRRPDVNTGNSLEFTLQLSPLEQTAPRRYIRIAMAFPWNQQTGILEGQLIDVHRSVCEALFKTIEHWPFLGGVFCPSHHDPTKLMLRYPEHISRQLLSRLVRIQPPAVGGTVYPNGDYNLSMSNFGKDRFVWDVDPRDDDRNGDWFPPVTIKISFVDGTVVLGFAFSENLFDGESIKNVLNQFAAHSNYLYFRPFRVNNRPVLDINHVQVADFDLLPFYDWSCNAIEPPTPRRNLNCQVITLSNDVVQDLHGIVVADKNQVALYEDSVLALFWVAIMRARFQNGRFRTGEIARVNYMLPGAWHTRSSRRNDPQYCGNSTITALATCDARDLIGAPDDPADGLPRIMRLNDFTLASQILRGALLSVSARTLSHLAAFKKTVSPDQERDAYERGIRRHSDSLTFENWACYGPDYAAGIPYAVDQVSYLFPCVDDMAEGTVILLPRRGEYWGEADWSICVCLVEADMDGLLHSLNREGWLIRSD
ncbi:hypothetical protein QQX98_009839 [Neonectria punicea]|uniref:Uncharacterized protein n=1 Tax=Neonectria punicea TaxID=979145 RepID=A0ABR1GR72_9HYPO